MCGLVQRTSNGVVRSHLPARSVEKNERRVRGTCDACSSSGSATSLLSMCAADCGVPAVPNKSNRQCELGRVVAMARAPRRNAGAPGKNARGRQQSLACAACPTTRIACRRPARMCTRAHVELPECPTRTWSTAPRRVVGIARGTDLIERGGRAAGLRARWLAKPCKCQVVQQHVKGSTGSRAMTQWTRWQRNVFCQPRPVAQQVGDAPGATRWSDRVSVAVPLNRDASSHSTGPGSG